MKKAVGRKIAERRKELGWSMEDLAEKLGYKSKSTILRIERGVVDLQQTKVAKFAEALGVSVAYLMDWDSTKAKNGDIADVTVRLRNDVEFANLVCDLGRLNNEQLSTIQRFVDVLLK